LKRKNEIEEGELVGGVSWSSFMRRGRMKLKKIKKKENKLIVKERIKGHES
jgi:hypothetical protein